jgi:SMC interacting uncharacterized protein involved in chromosome segregation
VDWLRTQLNILADGLNKKEQALREIVNITENQGTVIESGLTADETRAFLTQMNREKQQLIKTVIQCDNMFEAVLKEAGPALDAAPDAYKPQVAELQKRIRRVMDLDVKIRVYEEKNNALQNGKKPFEPTPAPGKQPTQTQPLPTDANRVIGAYAKNSRNYLKR